MTYQYSNPVRSRSGLSSTYLNYLPNGESIVLATLGDAPEIYESASGELQISLAGLPDNHFRDIVISDDGQFLFSAGDYGVVFWNMEQIANGNYEGVKQ